ncbi:unnamed protein product [Prorocentrum cordatum]|uniref:Uncharacterized protein n=1 Tax=Prorocentrum cordatum TaxID=2364126 RepID=A0ABN9REC4_9DINO|nr:unnamed protein product [Polarella glacialis]
MSASVARASLPAVEATNSCTPCPMAGWRKGHPDRLGHHLRILAAVLKKRPTFIRTYRELRDIAVFWGFADLYQGSTDDTQQCLLELGPGFANVIYGHSLVIVYCRHRCHQEALKPGVMMAEVGASSISRSGVSARHLASSLTSVGSLSRILHTCIGSVFWMPTKALDCL